MCVFFHIMKIATAMCLVQWVTVERLGVLSFFFVADIHGLHLDEPMVRHGDIS